MWISTIYYKIVFTKKIGDLNGYNTLGFGWKA